MTCTRSRQLLPSRFGKLKKVDPSYVLLVLSDSYSPAAYAIIMRSSEYGLSPPMLHHIVNQVDSGGTET